MWSEILAGNISIGIPSQKCLDVGIGRQKGLDYWSLWLKNQGSNSEDCKKAFIAQETTAWLETAGVNVIKISEIRQPAAELLNPKGYEEGSETMH